MEKAASDATSNTTVTFMPDLEVPQKQDIKSLPD
jgi:hypothetical protein